MFFMAIGTFSILRVKYKCKYGMATVYLSHLAYGQEWLAVGFLIFFYVIRKEKKLNCIFFSVGFVVLELCPFFHSCIVCLQ